HRTVEPMPCAALALSPPGWLQGLASRPRQTHPKQVNGVFGRIVVFRGALQRTPHLFRCQAVREARNPPEAPGPAFATTLTHVVCAVSAFPQSVVFIFRNGENHERSYSPDPRRFG